MAAAEKFHSEAEKGIYELLEKLVEDQRSDLEDVRFIILMKHGGWKSKGKIVFGKVKPLSDDMRFTMKKDALVYLNADQWKAMSDKQRLYVLESTLHSLVPKYDKHGDMKSGNDGFPALTTTPYDIEGYADVIRRHGPVMEEVRRLAKALTETNQMTIDDVAEQDESEALPEAHEGITGKINQDGTVEVSTEEEEDDPNQTKIEDYIEPDQSESGLDNVEPIETSDDDLPF